MSCPSRIAAAEPVSVAGGKPEVLARLRARLARITGSEKLESGRASIMWNLGIPAMDGHLPETGLNPAGLHEIAPADYPDMPAAMGFAASLAVRRALCCPKPVLWLRSDHRRNDMGELYGAGLENLGLDRARLITTRMGKPAHLLWALEEALRANLLGLVITDAPEAVSDLTISRRLHLAASEGATPGLLVSAKPPQGGTAATTRWRVRALPSTPDPYDPEAPGAPAWGLELTRCRGGKPGEWHVEWHHAAHCFSLVSGFPDRTVAGGLPEAGRDISGPSGPALRAVGVRR